MVKEAKFFKKQIEKAETAARASSDTEVSKGLLALALAYRTQAALIAKKQNAKPKKISGKANPAAKKAKRKRRS